MAFSPLGFSTLIAALLAPRIVAPVGAPRQLILGLGVAAIGLLWLADVGARDSHVAHILGPQILIGFGFGLCFLPLTASATADVPIQEAGLASGLINTTRQLGGALGLAVMATVATSVTTNHQLQHSTIDSLTSGYRVAFLMAGCGLMVGALLATLLSKPPVTTAKPELADELIDDRLVTGVVSEF